MDDGVVCFDWGGVILRICRGFPEGVAAAGLELRVGADDPDLYDVRRAHSLDYQRGAMSEQDFFRSVSDSFRGLYSPEEIAAIHDAWLLEEYEGVAELVDELHAHGRTTGMLSNTNARHWARRERDFPTAGTLGHQHASHLLRAAKPDGAIYKAFERESGYSGPQVVFFDDLEANIEAARSHGWRAVLIDHTGDTAAQMRSALNELGVL